jgi:hypothetical protein
MDRCGTCDTDPTNDCWKGMHGLATFPVFPGPLNLGSGTLMYSMNDPSMQRGFFLAGDPYARPPLEVAQTTHPNTCDSTNYPDNPGYMGLASVHELADAASLSYDNSGPTVLFGTESSSCYTGLLVYRQSNLYGVLRFIDINADETLDVEYWIGEAGVTDFRNAP